MGADDRYWISVSIPEENEYIPKPYIGRELKRLGFQYTDVNNLVYKTTNPKTLKDIKEKLKDILRREYPDRDMVELASITIQPRCLKCNKLLPFSNKYCDRCDGESSGISYVDL